MQDRCTYPIVSNEQDIRLLPATGEPIPDPTIYLGLIGADFYLIVTRSDRVFTRSDIQSAINNLS